MFIYFLCKRSTYSLIVVKGTSLTLHHSKVHQRYVTLCHLGYFTFHIIQDTSLVPHTHRIRHWFHPEDVTGPTLTLEKPTRQALRLPAVSFFFQEMPTVPVRPAGETKETFLWSKRAEKVTARNKDCSTKGREAEVLDKTRLYDGMLQKLLARSC